MLAVANSLGLFILVPCGLIFAVACLGMIGSDLPRGPLPPYDPPEDEDAD